MPFKYKRMLGKKKSVENLKLCLMKRLYKDCLTLSCLEISLGMNYKLEKYLKESCKSVSDQDFSFKSFRKVAF